MLLMAVAGHHGDGLDDDFLQGSHVGRMAMRAEGRSWHRKGPVNMVRFGPGPSRVVNRSYGHMGLNCYHSG